MRPVAEIGQGEIKETSLTQSLLLAIIASMAKVTGKLQITLPKALAESCGIQVGDELDLRPIGKSIRIDRRSKRDTSDLRRDRLSHFDQASTRQRNRERRTQLDAARTRGWTREELYTRGRTR